MGVSRDGSFAFEISAPELARGLRPSKHSPRNVKYLTIAKGVVGIDEVLQSIQNLEELVIDITPITDSFPYPQIFVFTNMIIVCDETDIYELVGGSLVHQLGPLTAGVRWTAADYYEFVYMSNGKVAVLRDANSKTYALTTDQPIASAICNFNGQTIIGAPDVELT